MRGIEPGLEIPGAHQCASEVWSFAPSGMTAQRAAFRRPQKHRPRFQKMHVASARLEPNRRAELQRRDIDHGNGEPKAHQAPAAVGDHGCGRRAADARMQDQHQAGEDDREQRHDAADFWADPARRRHDRRHQRSDQRGAQRDVVPAPRDQRHLDVAVTLQQRHADRKRNGVDDQAGQQCPLEWRISVASTSHTTIAAPQATSALRCASMA